MNKTKPFNCELCNRSFSHVNSRRRHYKNLHNGYTSKTLKKQCYKCGICGSTINVNEFSKHLLDQHEIVLNYVNIELQNFSEFEKWKKSVEEEENSFFVKHRGTCRPSGKKRLDSAISSIVYYHCNRSGKSRGKSSSPTDRKRHCKIQGSSKINAHCPARIKAVLNNDGKINVTFCKTHVGHGVELAHIPLPSDVRKEIASKIAQKIPFETILEGVRSVSGELKRKHIVTRQDLHNIIKEHSLHSECVRRSDDALSIEAWVDQVRASDSNCILLYKPNGIESPDYPQLKSQDFMLGIMTEAQSAMLKKYGHDCVCIDSIHGTDDYKFEMTTLLVLDDVHQGFPCAFYFSNRNDHIGFEIFLKCIRDSVGIVNTKVLMTDMADVFYNSWKCIMGDVEKRLFCTWNVQRAWQKKINQIKDDLKRKETSKKIITLHYEVNEIAFEVSLPVIVNELCADKDSADFGKYFLENYVGNRTSWANCYCKNAGIHTNNHLKRLHGIFKHFYFRGKKVKRLDITVHALMRFINRKLFDRLIVLHKGKITSKVRTIRERHKRSLGLLTDSVLQSSNDTWSVFSSSSLLDVYTVTLNETACSCALICHFCKACIHKFNCTCIDASIWWNMCKHIHLVCRSQTFDLHNKSQAEANIDRENDLNTSKLVSHEDDNSSSCFSHEDDNSFEKSEILSAVSKHGKKFPDSDLDTQKQEVRDSLEMTMSKIHSVEQLEIIRKALKSADAQINAVGSISGHFLA